MGDGDSQGGLVCPPMELLRAASVDGLAPSTKRRRREACLGRALERQGVFRWRLEILMASLYTRSSRSYWMATPWSGAAARVVRSWATIDGEGTLRSAPLNSERWSGAARVECCRRLPLRLGH